MSTNRVSWYGFGLIRSNVCFSLTKAKRAKCMLFLSILNKINSISVRLLYWFLGFFNFICELVPYFKSFLWIWHNQLKSSKSNRLKFSRISVQAIWDLPTSPSFYRSWAGCLESEPLVCFSDATPSRVAFASDRGAFSKPLPLPLPILN